MLQPPPKFNAGVAQFGQSKPPYFNWIEDLPCKQTVRGSSPRGGSEHDNVTRWTKLR